MLVFNSIFGALTCWTIYRTALRIFGRDSCHLVGLGLGALSRHDFLVGALDLGDQPVGVPAQPAVHADGRDGRRRAHLVVDRLRTAVGRRGAQQSFGAGVSALRRMLAGVSAASPRQALRRSCSRQRRRLLDDDHALAGAQLRGDGPVRLHPRQFRQRAAHRQQSAGRRPVCARLSSHAKRSS